MKKRLLLFLTIFLLVAMTSNFASAGLGITPAKKEFSFRPGEEININFQVLTDKPERTIEIYAEGTFANYTTFNKQTVVGEETFKATVKFPKEASGFRPGKHSLLIGVKEYIPENERQFFSTQVEVRALVEIFVPYPGKFAEVQLIVPDGNINEKIPVEVKVTGRGEDEILTNVKVNFYEQDQIADPVYVMVFQPATIGTDEEVFFRKYLETAEYRPGDYLAEAIVDYTEDLVVVNDSFRIGSVFINISNFTESLRKGGIRKFNIGIESRWNNDFDAVFADVNVSNANQSMTFRTPTIALKAWRTDNLVGFLDTSDLSGKYNTEIVLHYANQMTIANGLLMITTLGRMVVVGVILLIIVLCVVAYILWKRRQNRKKSR